MSTDVLIGTGGWAYFNIPVKDRLALYSKYFDFVEVNSTYYKIPSIRIVESWRKRVPECFEFSVRCNRSMYIGNRLRKTGENMVIIRKMIEILNILKSNLLHFQTPQNFLFNQNGLNEISKFFKELVEKDIKIVWEIRSRSDIPNEVFRLMSEFGVIHCVDISGEEPKVDSEILYSRIFGKGVYNTYQFDDKELEQINKEATKQNRRKSISSFHGVKMYSDAMRLTTYRKTGEFPMVTSSIGIDSLKQILSEDQLYPISKEDLLTRYGWRVFDLTETKKMHAYEIISKIPDQSYNNLNDLVESLSIYF